MYTKLECFSFYYSKTLLNLKLPQTVGTHTSSDVFLHQGHNFASFSAQTRQWRKRAVMDAENNRSSILHHVTVLQKSKSFA